MKDVALSKTSRTLKALEEARERVQEVKDAIEACSARTIHDHVPGEDRSFLLLMMDGTRRATQLLQSALADIGCICAEASDDFGTTDNTAK